MKNHKLTCITIIFSLLQSLCCLGQIADIKTFLETCPTDDPYIDTILNDFEIRLDGIVVDTFNCEGPVSSIPIEKWTQELITLQTFRTIFHMDRSGSIDLPWTDMSLYNWMKTNVDGINIITSYTGGGSCCSIIDGKKFFNMGYPDEHNRNFDRTWRGIAGNIGFYSHEIRHSDSDDIGHCNGCPSFPEPDDPYGCDPFYDESQLGAYGVQYWLNKAWLTGLINVGVTCSCTQQEIEEIINWHLMSIEISRKGRFLDDPPDSLSLESIKFPMGLCLYNMDIVDIPDTAFLYTLIEEGVDTDGDSLISYGEAEEVNILWLDSKGISDITGIEAFVNLDTLGCIYNQITLLDVTKNTSLRYLDCSDNQLNTLDVSGCTELTSLACDNNLINSLDLTANNALDYLSCSYNQLTNLDVSENTALNYLSCTFNQLTSLDISGCNKLTILSCDNNRIDSLDVTATTDLNYLHCTNNQLTNLDISGCNKLTDLACDNNQIESLVVSANSALNFLRCTHNQITSMDISGCMKLRSLFCNHNQIGNLDVTANTALTELDCTFNILSNLDVTQNIALNTLNCGGNQLTGLNILYNINLMTLWLEDMESLHEVCVWQGFDSNIADIAGSPNVCFETDCDGKCDDLQPPLIMAPDSVYHSDHIEVSISEDGMIYLVPVDTDKDMEMIRAACIDSVGAVMNTTVNIPLAGINNGTYWLYARDTSGNISEPKAFTIMGVGIEQRNSENLRIYPNPTYTLLTIETVTADMINIDITSQNGQLLFSKEMKGTIHHIDLSSFQKGVYLITIRSKDFVATRKIVKL